MTGQGWLFGVCWKKIKDISDEKLRKKAPNLGGLLDGEACFSIIHAPKDKARFYPCIALGMTHEATVDKAAKLLGVSKSLFKSKNPKHKDTHILRVTTQYECMQVCRALYRHSVTKRQQIKAIMEFLKLKPTLLPRGPKRRECLEKMADQFIICKKANHRGDPVDYDAMRKHLQELIEQEP